MLHSTFQYPYTFNLDWSHTRHLPYPNWSATASSLAMPEVSFDMQCSVFAAFLLLKCSRGNFEAMWNQFLLTILCIMVSLCFGQGKTRICTKNFVELQKAQEINLPELQEIRKQQYIYSNQVWTDCTSELYIMIYSKYADMAHTYHYK